MEIQKTFSSPNTETRKTTHTRVKSDSASLTSRDLVPISLLNKSKFPVFLVDCPAESKHYAMKVFPYQNDKPSNCYLKEARFSELSHPNIVTVVEHSPQRLSHSKGKSFYVSYILMELAPHSDFADLFMSGKLPHNETLARTYFRQLVDAVEYLHANGIAHMDIKPENILLGDNFQLKLTDFDSSVFLDEKRIGKIGTQNYRSPELKEGVCSDPVASDIYSAGIVMFVLLGNIFPYAEECLTNGHDLYMLMSSGDAEFWEAHPQCTKFPDLFTEDFKELFMGMVCENPNDRISIKDIKQSKWYNGPVYSDEELSEFMAQIVNSENQEL